MGTVDIHPYVIHLPITLIITSFLFQFIQQFKPYWICRTSPLWLLGFAVVSSFIASLSGEKAAIVANSKLELSNSTVELMNNHELFASITIWSSLAVFIVWLFLFLKYPGDRKVDIFALLFLFLLSFSVLVTGYLGSKLVFTHGVGVGY